MTKTDREKIQDIIGKTEELFEQKLTYISAGTLGLTLTFIEKIVPIGNSVAVIFLISGWGLLVLTLLINLSSHMVSKHYLMKTQSELDKDDENKQLDTIYSKVVKRNGRIDCLNWITVVLLVLGISSIVIFASLNSVKKLTKQENLIDKVKQDSTDNSNTSKMNLIDSTSYN